MKKLRRKIFGVPTIAIILIAALATGGIYAAFFWQKEVPVSVKIVGAEIEAYEDEACTIPLTAVDFGDLRQGEQSATMSFWLLNIGEDTLYPALAQDGLDPLLLLFEGDANAVPADPSNLPLATGEDITPGYWQETATTTTTVEALDDVALEVRIASGVGFPDSGMVKIDDELIAYASIVPTGDSKLLELSRGQVDTTAAIHADGSTVTLMEWVEEVSTSLYNLDPLGKLQVNIYLEADSTITRSDKPFTLLIFAQDTEF